jgi:hypothetical protein
MNEDATGSDAMESSDKPSPPVWFWVTSIIALLWYLMDVSAFFMRVLMTEEAINAMAEVQQPLYRNMPLWVNVVFAGEVFGGAFGSIGLLLKKTWALPLFVLSIVGVLCQTFYVYFLSDAISIMGAPAVVMPLVAIAIGVGMIALTKSATSRLWLR